MRPRSLPFTLCATHRSLPPPLVACGSVRRKEKQGLSKKVALREFWRYFISSRFYHPSAANLPFSISLFSPYPPLFLLFFFFLAPTVLFFASFLLLSRHYLSLFHCLSYQYKRARSLVTLVSPDGFFHLFLFDLTILLAIFFLFYLRFLFFSLRFVFTLTLLSVSYYRRRDLIALTYVILTTALATPYMK